MKTYMYKPIQLKPNIQPQQKMKTKNTTTLSVKNSIGPSPLRCGLFLIALALACFALSPAARAVLPAPDGGYPGFNTAEGDDALFSLTTGNYNTATGFDALYYNTTGYSNTATGESALIDNTTGNNNTATGVTALAFNTTGTFNTANGYEALLANTSPFCCSRAQDKLSCHKL